MIVRGHHFQTGNDWNGDSFRPGFLDKMEVDFVVKKHLRNDIIGPFIHLFFQFFDVPAQIGGFDMFLRVAGYAYTKICFLGILEFFEVDSFVHSLDLLH